MNKYRVVWVNEIEAESAEMAVNVSFRELGQLTHAPNRGNNNFIVTDLSTNSSVDITAMDGLLRTEPIFVAQILGLAHLIWAGRGRG